MTVHYEQAQALAIFAVNCLEAAAEETLDPAMVEAWAINLGLMVKGVGPEEEPGQMRYRLAGWVKALDRMR